jgi:hypothetical protein
MFVGKAGAYPSEAHFRCSVKPELTQVKHILGAPLIGRLPALLANIRLMWKVSPGTNTLAYNENL